MSLVSLICFQYLLKGNVFQLFCMITLLQITCWFCKSPLTAALDEIGLAGEKGDAGGGVRGEHGPLRVSSSVPRSSLAPTQRYDSKQNVIHIS